MKEAMASTGAPEQGCKSDYGRHGGSQCTTRKRVTRGSMTLPQANTSPLFVPLDYHCLLEARPSVLLFLFVPL